MSLCLHEFLYFIGVLFLTQGVATSLIAEDAKLSRDDLTEQQPIAAVKQPTFGGKHADRNMNGYSNSAADVCVTAGPASDAADVACANVTNGDYNPHNHPAGGTGPWFEGWYARMTDEDGISSIAIGIGHFPGVIC